MTANRLRPVLVLATLGSLGAPGSLRELVRPCRPTYIKTLIRFTEELSGDLPGSRNGRLHRQHLPYKVPDSNTSDSMVEGGSILNANQPRRWVMFVCRFTPFDQKRLLVYRRYANRGLRARSGWRTIGAEASLTVVQDLTRADGTARSGVHGSGRDGADGRLVALSTACPGNGYRFLRTHYRPNAAQRRTNNKP